jgi:hypothetical protein
MLMIPDRHGDCPYLQLRHLLNLFAATDGFAPAFPLFAAEDGFAAGFAGFLISVAAAVMVLNDEGRTKL